MIRKEAIMHDSEIILRLMDEGQVDLAKKMVKENLIENPKDNNSWIFLSDLEEDYSRKVDCLLRSIKINSKNAQVRARLGGLYFLDQKYDKAEVQLRLALRFEPNDYDAHANLGYFQVSHTRFII
jgi:tetratricopeptide (TPR) repeat protein